MYNVFKQLGNGEFVQVASRDKLEDALQLAVALNAYWPGEYEVRDSHLQAVRYPNKLLLGRDCQTGNGNLNRFLFCQSILTREHIGRRPRAYPEAH